MSGIVRGTAGMVEVIAFAGDLDDLGVVQEAVKDRGGGRHVADEFSLSLGAMYRPRRVALKPANLDVR